MRALILAPNGGASLSTGGGTNFVLRQARALSQRRGVEVTIMAYHAMDDVSLSKYHNIDMTKGDIKVIASGVRRPYDLFRRSPVKLSAYDALLLPGFRSWLVRQFEKADPDWVWFHDDIPAVLCNSLGSRKVAMYVHFPFAGRDKRVCPVIDGSRSRSERINDALLRACIRRIVCQNPKDHASVFWANSRITARVASVLWGVTPHVVFPVEQEATGSAVEKQRSILSLGAFSRGKNYETLIRGFATSGLCDNGWTLTVAGAPRDGQYLALLRRLISRKRLDTAVRLLVDVSGDERDALLETASIIVHPAEFEPFGISLVEGMSYGAAAMAYAGEWSGAWVDTLDSGRFGIGFKTADDLARGLKLLASGELSRYQNLARERMRNLKSMTLEDELAALYSNSFPQ